MHLFEFGTWAYVLHVLTYVLMVQWLFLCIDRKMIDCGIVCMQYLNWYRDSWLMTWEELFCLKCAMFCRVTKTNEGHSSSHWSKPSVIQKLVLTRLLTTFHFTNWFLTSVTNWFYPVWSKEILPQCHAVHGYMGWTE